MIIKEQSAPLWAGGRCGCGGAPPFGKMMLPRGPLLQHFLLRIRLCAGMSTAAPSCGPVRHNPLLGTTFHSTFFYLGFLYFVLLRLVKIRSTLPSACRTPHLQIPASGCTKRSSLTRPPWLRIALTNSNFGIRTKLPLAGTQRNRSNEKITTVSSNKGKNNVCVEKKDANYREREEESSSFIGFK